METRRAASKKRRCPAGSHRTKGGGCAKNRKRRK